MVGGKQYVAVNVGWNSAIVSKLTNPDGSPFSYAPAAADGVRARC